MPLPIVLIWPFVFLLGALAALIALPFAAVRTWRCCQGLVGALFHLGGMSVRLENREGTEILVRFI